MDVTAYTLLTPPTLGAILHSKLSCLVFEIIAEFRVNRNGRKVIVTLTYSGNTNMKKRKRNIVSGAAHGGLKKR